MRTPPWTMDEPDGEWPGLAQRLGLAAHEHGVVPEQDAFAPLWTALGSPVSVAPVTRRHWLAGDYAGRRVVLRASESWVAHVMEVDPPLWLGLRATAGAGHSSPVIHGFPAEWFDRLMREQPEARAVASALHEVDGPWDATLGDSFVQIGLGSLPPVPQARAIEALDRASNLAALLERLRQAMAPAPWRDATQRECEDLAASLGLELDAARLTLTGRTEGLEVGSGVVLVRLGPTLEARVRAVVGFGQELDLGEDRRARARATMVRVAGLDTTVEVHCDRVEASRELSEAGGGMRQVLEGALEAALDLTGRGQAHTPYR